MRLQSAHKAFERGDSAEARRLVLDILQTRPGDEDAWALLMRVARDQDEREKAVERLTRLNPQHPELLALKASNAPPPVAGKPGEQAGAVYEMQWDCAFCGTRKLLGKTHRFCPNCGAAQEADKRYFPTEEEKVAVKDHVYVGADLKCPACQTPNSGNAEFCIQCGSPLTDAARAKRQDEQTRTGKGWQGAAELQQETDAARAKNKRLFYMALAVIAAIVAAVLVVVFWTQDVSLELMGHSWQREIKIENFGPRSESAWCDAMPGAAYSVSRKSEVRSYKQIPDGETCTTKRMDQGDGTYKEVRDCQPKYRSEPVYGDKCYYSVDRWAYARSITAQGQDKKPYWPEARLQRPSASSGNGACQGCEREAGREEHYTLLLAAPGGKSYECEVEQARWQSAESGSRWRMAIGVIGGGARCNSLEAVQ